MNSIQLITVEVTPSMLIDLAKKLQTRWDKAEIGEELPRVVLDVSQQIRIELVIDQEAMHTKNQKSERV
jgi:hypothetical protein